MAHSAPVVHSDPARERGVRHLHLDGRNIEHQQSLTRLSFGVVVLHAVATGTRSAYTLRGAAKAA